MTTTGSTCCTRPGILVAAWRSEVYGYFNNDGGGNAVRNARYLRDLTRADCGS